MSNGCIASACGACFCRSSFGNRAWNSDDGVQHSESLALNPGDKVQHSEDRAQYSEGRAQHSEGRVQHSGDGAQHSEHRVQHTEDRAQCSEARVLHSEDRAQQPESRARNSDRDVLNADARFQPTHPTRVDASLSRFTSRHCMHHAVRMSARPPALQSARRGRGPARIFHAPTDFHPMA